MTQLGELAERQNDVEAYHKRRSPQFQGDPSTTASGRAGPEPTPPLVPDDREFIMFSSDSLDGFRNLQVGTEYDVSWVPNGDVRVTSIGCWGTPPSDTKGRVELQTVYPDMPDITTGMDNLQMVLVNARTTSVRLVNLDAFSGLFDREMFIRVGWEFEGYNGYSFSGNFTVQGNVSDDETKGWPPFENPEEYYEGQLPTSTDTSVLSTAEPTGQPTGQSSLSPESTHESDPSTTFTSGEGGNSEESQGGGNDGLSTGAIAGIAVGASVGLILIIALLVWLFVLRPRRKRRMRENASNSSSEQVHGDAPVLIADKEVSRMDDSPHEPYTENTRYSAVPGAVPQQPREGPEDQSYMPYQNVAPAGSRQDLTRSGAATPQGVPTSVAHLVEEGMTEDEIRRLEEEERQLDDAIERHRRR